MFIWIAAFLAGVVLLQYSRVLPSESWLLILPLVFLPACFRNLLAILLSGLIAGYLWALFSATYLMPPELDDRCLYRSLPVTGVVSGIPVRDERRIRFDLLLMATTDSECMLPETPVRIRLSWYEPEAEVSAGDMIATSVKLRRPRNFYNPGGFDYESYLLAQGIRYSAYVRSKVSMMNQAVSPTIRVGLSDWLVSVLEPYDSSGMITALVTGDRSGLNPKHYEVLRRTGTMHLMAISGLHIGMVAGAVFTCILVLAKMVPGMTLYIPAVRVAALVAILAAAAYAAIAGFTLPTQRALIMLVLFMLGMLFSRRFSPARIYFLALLIVLIHDPYSVTQAGFWLSFTAVGILLFLLNRSRQNSTVMRWSRAQLGLMVGLLPLNLLYFQGVSIIAPLANLIAIPWVGLGVLPAALVGSLMNTVGLPMADTIVSFAAVSLDYLFAVLSKLSTLDLAWISLPQPSPFLLLLMMVAGLLFLLPFRVSGPVVAICLLLPLARPPLSPEYGTFWLDVLDVGDGQSAIIRTHQNTLVFDTGPRLGDRFDTGAAVVVPFLSSRGVGQVSVLLISHGDNDHAGGVSSVLGMKKVALHMASDTKTRPLADKPCIAGQRWHWEGVDFEIIHPDQNWPFTGNDGSCVLMVSNGSSRLLIPGDIEGMAELRLSREKDIQADVLMVPHHGSKTSSSQAFLDAVDPVVAIVSAGNPSRYHFPHPDVVSRYRKAGIMLLNTAQTGHIQMKFDGNSQALSWDTYMPASRRYWNSLPLKE